MIKVSLAFDVGKNGGIAVIQDGIVKLVASMPKIKNEIDINAICDILEPIVNQEDEVLLHCGIEDVHSIFGVGAKANFQFGRSLGILEGLTSALAIPFTKIAPKTWQKEIWMGVQPIQINTGKKTKEGNIKFKVDTKGTSQLVCKRLYPSLNLKATERSKKDHDGIIDALLIATYVYRKL